MIIENADYFRRQVSNRPAGGDEFEERHSADSNGLAIRSSVSADAPQWKRRAYRRLGAALLCKTQRHLQVPWSKGRYWSSLHWWCFTRPGPPNSPILLSRGATSRWPAP